ncbi:glycosyltransferase family 32 protein [Fructilactobacillus sanfranciscensis]|uniref:glycosyltransferase family 32 protein n=1 Tax=Fructilactobacillus sanfranciscensis TaxID=1625 RepID=UPI0013D89427|nr:glycosyltransferase [Fructilactobacillus sanfranciscensis]MDN4462270.1 glycosyltransferase [Fructilactobacillus sanfranciscensis]NDR62024.1 glycosyltransferase [Fructilactobacillus sanfranciscensis]
MTINYIPKVIHLIDITGTGKLEQATKYSMALKKFASDYEIKVWTNDNLPDVVTQNTYYRAAMSNSQYAFASDVARMWVLLNEGGIYLDSDVELKKSFNPILKYNFFAGYESQYTLSTACIGAMKNNSIVREVWDRYSSKSALSIESFLKVPNVEYLSIAATNHGFTLNGNESVKSNQILFKQPIFSPRFFYDRTKTVEQVETMAIHQFSGSWTNKAKFKNTIIKVGQKLFGDRLFLWMRMYHRHTRRY